MTSRAAWLATLVVLGCTAAAVAGCGLGAGPSSPGTATLTVTRDYGSKTMLMATEADPPSSQTVLRFLDGRADITTRYGGGFVQSIDGLAGMSRKDWFFYVDGTESPVGAAQVDVRGGDRIWWDYRDWSAAMTVPAVVGSWPEPFAQASSGAPRPVVVQCLDVAAACRVAKDRLREAGVSAGLTRKRPAEGSLRLLVGTWDDVGSDPAVDELREPGVFATFKMPGRPGGHGHLVGLDQGGTPARDLGGGAGLVAAVGRPPTWIVTGSRRAAVIRAAKLLKERYLRNRYAVAAPRGRSVPLPIMRPGGAS